MRSIWTSWVAPCIVAIAVGCFAVNVDLHNNEVQAAVLVLLVGGFVVGVAWPAHAWVWALILGLSIAIGDYLAPRAGLVSVTPQPFNAGALIALIPAFVGTYVGVGARALIRGAAKLA